MLLEEEIKVLEERKRNLGVGERQPSAEKDELDNIISFKTCFIDAMHQEMVNLENDGAGT